MYIEFKDRKLKKNCEDFKNAQKAWGHDNALKLMQRLNEISAATCLEDLNYLPPARCHPLSGNRKGQYAIDVKQPFRLILEPILDNIGQACTDISKINKIKIIEVVNYHE